MKTVKYTAPADWASFLINQDGSGLSAKECDNARDWLASLPHARGRLDAVAWPVDCENVGFKENHTARVYASCADCCEYTFILGG